MQGVGTLESPGGEPKYFNTTGHYYQWVESKYHYSYTEFSIGINWQTAQLDAFGRCYKGQRGYLATITSAEEQEFISSLIPDVSYPYYFVGWLGGSDRSNEGEWLWTGGPEKGQYFWSGGPSNGDGQTVGTSYENWYCYQDTQFPYCEPNESNNQDCLHMYGDGRWNDVSCSLETNGYFVEFGMS
eukprot:FR741709.1.p2 GENE.FR741709.1~~FR741709.1.p2  ORF type:complete len:194 (+),score=10.32 FR741709.1:29-583(+)